MSEVHCYFFAALPCEAKPLIEHFKLKKDLSVSAFTIYRNTDITLTVTGVGKTAMAAGVAYTLALFPAMNLPALLNIGIAGHHSHGLGTAYVIEKISDQETGRSYYPQLVVTPPCLTHALVTVAQAQADYESNAIYEMEASAFYEIAMRLCSSELIQCIKVISDNKDNPSTQIKPAQVSRWVSDILPLIEKFSEQIRTLASLSMPLNTARYTEIITQWHFTKNEKIQLSSLLNKRTVLIKDRALDITKLPQTSAKEVLIFLREEVDRQVFGGF